jgi:polyhydroxyalkanoate synthesis regulator phasin
MNDATVKIAGDVTSLLSALLNGRLGMQAFRQEVQGVGGAGAALEGSFVGMIAKGTFLGTMLKDLAQWALRAVKDAVVGVVNEFARGVGLSNEFNTALTGLRAVAAGTGQDMKATEQAARDLSQDGLLSIQAAAGGLKNLLSAGFGLPDAIRLMNAAKDSAAFNRQGMLSLNEAVERFTQGIKFNNSALTDSTGLGKNLSVIMKEAGYAQDAAGRAAQDAGVRQAILNGFLKEAALFTGNAAKYAETYGGQIQRLRVTYETFLATLGDSVTKNETVIAVVKLVGDAFNGLSADMDGSRKLAFLVSDSLIFLVKAINPLLTALDFMQQAWHQGKVAMNLILAAIASVEVQVYKAALAMRHFMISMDPTGLLAKSYADNIKNLEDNLAGAERRMLGAAEAAAQHDQAWKENSTTITGWKTQVADAVVKLEATRGKLSDVTFATRENTRASKEAAEATGAFAKATNLEIDKLLKSWQEQPPAVRANRDAINILLESYEKLRRDATGPLPAELESIRQQYLKALPTTKAFSAEVNELVMNVGLVAPAATSADRALIGLNYDGTLASRTFNTLGVSITTANTPLMDHAKQQAEAAKRAQATRDALDATAEALENLSHMLPGAGGAIVSMLGSIAGAASTVFKGVDSIKAGFGSFTSGAGLTSMLTGFAGMAGGIGAIASSAIQMGIATVNAFKSVMGIRPEWQNFTRDIARDLDVNVSEATAKKMEATNKTIKDRWATTLIHLNDIIADAGGVTTANVEKWTGKLREVFVQIERGQLTVEQGAKVLNQVFPQLAKTQVDANGLISDSLLEIIQLNDRAGTKSAEVSKFVNEQARSAMTGLRAFLDNATVTTQQTADAVSAAIAKTFQTLRANGASTSQVVKELGPVITAFDAQLLKAGLQGSEAFNKIKALAATAGDDIVSKAMTAVDGLNQMMKGLHNAGLMDQDMFRGLAAQVKQTFDSLKAQGKDGNQILQLMQPTLQTLYEMQRKFGYAVDATTQEMIDEAKAAGLVGEHHMSATDKMLLATNKMVRALEGIARVMGVEIPAAADEMAGDTTAAGARIADQMNRTVRGSVEGVSRELAGTPWEQYANRGVVAARQAAGEFGNISYQAERTGRNILDSARYFQDWSNIAERAAENVAYEIDRISFGRSPGGIKEWAPMLRHAMRAFGDFEREAVADLDRVRRSVDSMRLPGMAAAFDGTLPNPRAVGAALRGPSVVNVPMTLANTVIADPQSLDWFTRTLQAKLAEQLGRDVRIYIDG